MIYRRQGDTQAKIIQMNVLYFYLSLFEPVGLLSCLQYEMVGYTFPAVGSQTKEHRGDVPSRADARFFNVFSNSSAYHLTAHHNVP